MLRGVGNDSCECFVVIVGKEYEQQDKKLLHFC